MIKKTTSRLIDRKDLACDEARTVMDEIMNDDTSPVQTAVFLTALSVRDETIEEVTAYAAGMHAHALPVGYTDGLLEIIGTGGDGSNSFNISTTSSIVIAADEARVAKHGDHAASSRSGAADCLKVLGMSTGLSPEQCVSLLQNVGVCFLFAQTYHSSMKYVDPVHKELNIRTIFNILGPLTNPAHANLQVLGMYSEKMVEPLVRMLHNLGVRRGMVVYGQDKLDEISLSLPTTVCKFNGDEFITYMIHPQDLGLIPYKKSELVGGTPQEDAQITLNILSRARDAGRDTVLLNAGVGLYVAGKAVSLGAGVCLVAELVDSDRTIAKLQELILESNRKEKAAS